MSSHKRPGAGEEGAGPSKWSAASGPWTAASAEKVRTSTTFIGIHKFGKVARKQIDGVQRCFHSQPCEDKAAALHDIATLWSLLRKHGALGGPCISSSVLACPAIVCFRLCPADPLHLPPYNFPGLLEEGSLLEELQGSEDWWAMQEVAESWLEGHWATKGQQLVAGWAEALARQVGDGRPQSDALRTARACSTGWDVVELNQELLVSLTAHCSGTGRDAAYPQKRYTGVQRKGHTFEAKIKSSPWHGSPQLTTGTFATSLEAAVAWDVGNLWRQLHYPGGQPAGSCVCVGFR